MHRDRDVLLATAESGHAGQSLSPAEGLYHQEATEEWTAAIKEVSQQMVGCKLMALECFGFLFTLDYWQLLSCGIE